MDQQKLLQCLFDIQTMCIGDLTYNYKLDANYIGQIISEATGMTATELEQFIKSKKD